METFIVRVWRPAPDLADEISPGELHGTVERVPSTERLLFRNGADLLTLMEASMRSEEMTALPERLKQT